MLKLFDVNKGKRITLRFVGAENLSFDIDEDTHIMVGDEGILVVFYDEGEGNEKKVLAVSYFPFTNIIGVQVEY